MSLRKPDTAKPMAEAERNYHFVRGPAELPVEQLKTHPSVGRRTGCPFHDVRLTLRRAGLRPTRQRLALGWLLYAQGGRHITAETLYEDAIKARFAVSLATVYNTLNQFTDAGLLRAVAVEGSKTYFDTDVSDHHHFYVEGSGKLIDVPDKISFDELPEAPENYEISRVDVVVRLKPKAL